MHPTTLDKEARTKMTQTAANLCQCTLHTRKIISFFIQQFVKYDIYKAKFYTTYS